MSIARVSGDDLMSLAADRGTAPMQVGVVLALDTAGGLDPIRLIEAIGSRVCSIPRLRQRLVDVSIGLGRPIWVDDESFSIAAHVGVTACPEPGGMAGVLLVAADLVTARLPRSRPLWAASVVTGVGDGCSALIFVFHHVLADGIGGLAVLDELAAAKPSRDDPEFPRPMPTRAELFADATRSRLASALALPSRLSRLGQALTEVGPSMRTTAARTSLNKPIGAERRFESLSYPLSDVRDAAHAAGGTVNDFALAVITGALHSLLTARGEHLDDVVVSIPFSSRAHASVGALGNKSGAVPLRLPATGESRGRLRRIASITRAAKAAPRGSSTAVLGPLFRALARIGLFQQFVDRQRTIHTIVTNIRASGELLNVGGIPVADIVPLGAIVGNVTAAFAVSSYMGRLRMTVVADPDLCPDVADLWRSMDEQYHQLLGSIPVGH